MIDQQTGEIASLVNTLTRSGQAPDSEALAKVGKTLAKLFGVDPDEVAILKIVRKFNLSFVIPEKLSIVGTIPLSSTTALAARTARDCRPELVNNFSTTKHASVFEGVSLGRDTSQVIHKIMSAPIMDGTRLRGVVQISRKAKSVAAAGPDFTQKDLGTLVSLSPILDLFLKLFQTD